MTFAAIQRFCIGVCCALFAPILLTGQSQQGHASHSQLPVVVDGKKTPDRIPDDLAWNHFLIVLSEHKNASAEELQRQQSRLTPLQLAPADAKALLDAISGLKENLDELEAQRLQSGSSQALTARWNAAITAVRGQARAALTPDGLKRVDAFIREQVKPAIVIYGSN
jgi:hypothetical protein